MDLDALVEYAERSSLHLKVNTDRLREASQQQDDAMFQVPLLALCILVIARREKNELRVADLSLLVATTLVEHFVGVKRAGPRLKWSIPLRRRCADGLVFLENAELVIVDSGYARTVSVSDLGKASLRKLRVRPDEVGMLVRGLDGAFRAAKQRGLELI